ncbi:head-tail connector protein [Agrobacterium tumefaciens]|uniref:head-tail connector protein n=1 Tax=Agrobacterium tumefaciens TaxID=358 RepID=UPI001572E2AB|nr:head-tail connector protein [Agrobacterium tumefaciens]WCK15408.1 head-tail connector protein [Agrobacterium tumefaciens]
MHRPVRVTAPEALPVSLEEVKKALRVDSADDDEMLTSLIQSAVDHYEGWTGVLGICLVDQTWRQSYDRYNQCLRLPLGPVIAVDGVKTRDAAGTETQRPTTDYSVETDAAGRSYVRFVDGFTMPGDVARYSAISIEYRAGWPIVDDKPTVPADIITAIIARVQIGYEQTATDASQTIANMERALIAKWRRPLL